MSHAPSLLFRSHLSTTSLSTCTPVLLSSRPSTRFSLLSTSHGDLPFADPSNVSFGPLAETHSTTGYVDRHTSHTSHFNTYSHCTVSLHCAVTFITRHAWLKTRIVCTIKILHHLARHVSCLDTRYTQHLHSVLTFLCYPAGLSTGGHICNPLRRSTTSSRAWQFSRTTSSHRSWTKWLQCKVCEEHMIPTQYFVTGWLGRVHLPHRERLRDALHNSKWTDPRRNKQQKWLDSQCSSQPWIRQTFNLVEEKFNMIRTTPESHRTNTLGDLITTQYIGAI